MDGFAAPIKLSCADHNGHGKVCIQQWDGTKWVKASDWIAPMKDKVRPLIEARPRNMSRPTPAGRSGRRLATSRS